MNTAVTNYEVHPAADLFPLIQGAAFDVLVEDIRQNGLLLPLLLDGEGLLIDGRNRLRACIAAGVEPRAEVYPGGDVIKFITSHNIHRRHLTDSQRAMIAAELANLPWGGDRKSDAIKSSSEDLIATPAVTRAEAKELMQVSEGSLHRAKVIQRQGVPELNALVKETNLPLVTAVRVSELSEESQREYVDKVRAGADPVQASPPRATPVEKSDTKKKPWIARQHRKTIGAVVRGGQGVCAGPYLTESGASNGRGQAAVRDLTPEPDYVTDVHMVLESLTPIGVIPKRQARELAPLRDGPEKRLRRVGAALCRRRGRL